MLKLTKRKRYATLTRLICLPFLFLSYYIHIALSFCTSYMCVSSSLSKSNSLNKGVSLQCLSNKLCCFYLQHCRLVVVKQWCRFSSGLCFPLMTGRPGLRYWTLAFWGTAAGDSQEALKIAEKPARVQVALQPPEHCQPGSQLHKRPASLLLSERHRLFLRSAAESNVLQHPEAFLQPSAATPCRVTWFILTPT